MVDKHFLVIKIPLAIVAPWPAENLVNIRVTALLLAHPVGSPAGSRKAIGNREKIESAMVMAMAMAMEDLMPCGAGSQNDTPIISPT